MYYNFQRVIKMELRKILIPAYRKQYFEGYSIGLNPYLQFNAENKNEAFIAGFEAGRLDYEKLNGYISDGIPERIVTNKVLEDFLIAGLLGLSIDTDGFSSYQLNVLAKWYQSGTEKYEPNQSNYLFEILEENGIDLN